MTPKRQRFVAEYMADLNATAAAARAGYRGSSHTLEVTGSELLRKPEVAALVAEEQARRSARTAVTADMVVRELAIVAFSDVGRAFSDVGMLLPIHLIPADVRRAFASVDPVAGKVRMADKNRALELLARHLGMLHDRVEVAVVDGRAGRLKRARARIAAQQAPAAQPAELTGA